MQSRAGSRGNWEVASWKSQASSTLSSLRVSLNDCLQPTWAICRSVGFNLGLHDTELHGTVVARVGLSLDLPAGAVCGGVGINLSAGAVGGCGRVGFDETSANSRLTMLSRGDSTMTFWWVSWATWRRFWAR